MMDFSMLFYNQDRYLKVALGRHWHISLCRRENDVRANRQDRLRNTTITYATETGESVSEADDNVSGYIWLQDTFSNPL